MAVFDKSPRAPGNRLAGSEETVERAQCNDPDPRCGSSFPVISIADDVVAPSRMIPTEARSNVIWTPVLRSAVHENTLSPQLGAPTARPALAMFSPDPPQPTWTTQGTRLSKNEQVRGAGPVQYPSPNRVHRHGGDR